MAILGVLVKNPRMAGDQVTRAWLPRWAWRGGEGCLARCTVSGRVAARGHGRAGGPHLYAKFGVVCERRDL